jgi:hypothetical protein
MRRVCYGDSAVYGPCAERVSGMARRDQHAPAPAERGRRMLVTVSKVSTIIPV